MASQPVYYPTHAHPAGGTAAPPPPQYQGPAVHPAVHRAAPPPPRYQGPVVHHAPPPAPQYPGPGVHRAAPSVPQYPGPAVHVVNPAVSQYPGPSTSGGYPPPPSYSAFRSQNANRPAHQHISGPGVDYDGDGVNRSNKRGGKAPPTAVESESRKWKWAMFVVGNLISVAVVVSEIASLEVCFDENLGDDDDTPEENAETVHTWTLIVLVYGLWVDVFSAIALSVIYQSPLDIKSAHKIPPTDTRNLKMTAIINFLVPFTWGLVYFGGGFLSIMYGDHSTCDGRIGGSALESYLEVSGVLMAIFSFVMLGLSVPLARPACCCSSNTPPGVHSMVAAPPRCCCTTWNQDMLHKRIFAKSAFFDLGWQLQGTILSYRLGSFSGITAVLVGSSGVLGELLAAFGSLAPAAVQELAGPAIA